MKLSRYQIDSALYIAIAVISALMATKDPITWREMCFVGLAALNTWKAKRSEGKDSQDANHAAL